ncbi:MAG: oligosaccharide flippase family protein, partial [Planctomycetes bacterium]|nr:oligosaccharide flippase family protein [Planctomycetota bacterium]
MTWFAKIKASIKEKLAGDSLKAKCLRGSIALTGGTLVERSFRFVRTIILAKILMPASLGRVALVTTAAMIFEAINEVGVKHSVIQNAKGAQKEYLNVAWWFQAVRAFCLFIIAWLLAPMISRFYEDAGMLMLLRVTFVSMLFNGLISPRVHVLEKQFDFKKAVILTQTSALVSTLATIVLVFYLRNEWSLVIGFVLEPAMLCILSYILCPFKSSFSIDRESFTDILHFARGMLGLPILTLVAFQLDVIVLGKMVSKELVGMYFLAFALASVPRQLFGRIVGRLLVPIFSRKQDDLVELRRSVLSIASVCSVITIPLAMFFITTASALLVLAYKPEYTTVAIPFCLLSVIIVLRIQSIIFASMYIAIGRPGYHRAFVGLRAVVLAVLIYPAISVASVTGAAAAVLIAETAGFIAQIIFMQKRISLLVSDYFNSMLPGIGVSIIVAAGAVLLSIIGVDHNLIRISVGMAAFLAACACGLLILKASMWQGAVKSAADADHRSKTVKGEDETSVILLGASFDTGNLGVSALAEASIKCIVNHWQNCKIALFATGTESVTKSLSIGDKEVEATSLPVRFCPNIFRADHFVTLAGCGIIYRILPFAWVKRLLSRCNRSVSFIISSQVAADITGGDSFSDIYGRKRLILGILTKWLILLYRKELILLPQTYGPFHSPLASWMAKQILKRSHVIFSRDADSIACVKNILGPLYVEERVRLIPDVAFVLDPKAPDNDGMDAMLESLPENTTVVGMNVSGLLYNGGYTRDNMFRLNVDYRKLTRDIIDLLMSDESVVMVFLPHVFPPDHLHVESDRDACLHLIEDMDQEYKDRIYIPPFPCDHAETKYLIGMTDFFIGARMHSCIAAMSQAVPTVGIAYS